MSAIKRLPMAAFLVKRGESMEILKRIPQPAKAKEDALVKWFEVGVEGELILGKLTSIETKQIMVGNREFGITLPDTFERYSKELLVRFEELLGEPVLVWVFEDSVIGLSAVLQDERRDPVLKGVYRMAPLEGRVHRGWLVSALQSLRVEQE